MRPTRTRGSPCSTAKFLIAVSCVRAEANNYKPNLYLYNTNLRCVIALKRYRVEIYFALLSSSWAFEAVTSLCMQNTQDQRGSGGLAMLCTGPDERIAYRLRLRPYLEENTRSHPNSEVKPQRARSVPRWGTAREPLRVLSAFSITHILPRALFDGDGV